MTHTYKARISGEAIDYRLSILALLDTVIIEREGDSLEVIITCDEATAEAVEYELRKADRRDDEGCEWKKII
jgi:hypothetical protein